MTNRVIVSSMLTFALGLGGGVVGARLSAAPGSLSLATQPASAGEIRVAPNPGQPDGIADLVDSVKVAVVNIDTVTHRHMPADQAQMFRFFFDGRPGQMPPGADQVQKGVGSGFIIKENGLIVTNNHVVQGAEQLTVTLSNGQKYPGKVVGTDPATDVALVKIAGEKLPTLRMADPKTLRVGQLVVAVGSPLGLQQTVTSGILSAIDRDISLNARVGFLQTDAAINPGNSGGPLLNIRGEVIGVNTAIAARGQGIGFAIPVDVLNDVVPQLQAAGHVDRAWLGVGIGNLPEDRSQLFYPADHGALVGRVEPNGPAARAGVQPGDILLTLDGKRLENAAGLIREVSKLPVGKHVEVGVSRAGQQKTLTLTLDKMPEKLAAAPQEGQPDEGP